MKIKERSVGGVTVLDLDGKIVLGEGDEVVRNKVREVIAAGHRKVLLNLARVPYVDSAGLGELVRCHTRVVRADGQIKLLNLTSRMQGPASDHEAGHRVRDLRVGRLGDLELLRGDAAGAGVGGTASVSGCRSSVRRISQRAPVRESPNAPFALPPVRAAAARSWKKMTFGMTDRSGPTIRRRCCAGRRSAPLRPRRRSRSGSTRTPPDCLSPPAPLQQGPAVDGGPEGEPWQLLPPPGRRAPGRCLPRRCLPRTRGTNQPDVEEIMAGHPQDRP